MNCGIGEMNNYRNANGEQRQSMTVDLPTIQRLQRGILFDVSKANVLSYGGTFMLINVILKKDLNTIVMTTRSKVLKTWPVLTRNTGVLPETTTSIGAFI